MKKLIGFAAAAGVTVAVAITFITAQPKFITDILAWITKSVGIK